MPPPYMEDLRGLAEKAPIVFRGRVSSVTQDAHSTDGLAYSIANFQIDRIYRGLPLGEASIKFRYNPIVHGHDCIDFQVDTYWLVLAKAMEGHLEVTDDCVGAMMVGRQLGANAAEGGWTAQMEADFLAGLQTGGTQDRIVSLQRLAGWHSTSTRAELHQVIEHGSKEEAKWAVYAALRTGDISVLPQLKELLTHAQERNEPEWAMAFELRNVSDSNAVPELIAIMNSSQIQATRALVLTALTEKIQDPRAVPTFAASLKEQDPQVQWLALWGMQKMSGSPACSLPLAGSTDEVALQEHITECESWWESEGKFGRWE